MTIKTKITVAEGDGIGPSIMEATLDIMEAAGAQIEPEFIVLGEKAYLDGVVSGIPEKAWESIERTGILFKAPLTTPQGGGYQSVNVNLRKAFGMFANVRPVRTFEPYVSTKHANVDMVIVRENEEDLYAGIEYRQTLNTCHSVKFVSRTGTELIIRYAFEYARANGRKKVTALIKDNIMKITDGLFHKSFDLIAKEYPEIENEALIVDIGMARVADTPENFDVLVTLNLYGDIVSDIASQISGSVGLAGSMNIGHTCALYEAIHGSAPDIAGQGIANPSGLLNAAVLMLNDIGQGDVASKISNALLKTLEDGSHTGDIAKDKSKALNTKDFTQAVIANLGQKPSKLAMQPPATGTLELPQHVDTTRTDRVKTQIGIDVFVDWDNVKSHEVGDTIKALSTDKLELFGVSIRGLKVYPGKVMNTNAVTDHWRCRFKAVNDEVSPEEIADLVGAFNKAGISWTKMEGLFTFDGEIGYSLMQGES